jgi:CRP/FNR family transcriptional regulator, anaerobic regulatory protein
MNPYHYVMSAPVTDQKRLDVHNSDVPVVCRSCEARHKGICGALTPKQLLALSKGTSKHHIPADRQISAEGGEPNAFSNIMSGVVKLSKLLPDGRQQIVALQFAPDLVGRPFDAQNKTSVDAATDVRLCSFPVKILEDLITESPDLEHKLHQQNLRELDEARDLLLALGRKSAAERVASFIYFIACHIDPEASIGHATLVFQIPLKRSDIADFLGLTLETVSRQMTKLRQAGIISIIDRRSIAITNLEKLQRLAGTN